MSNKVRKLEPTKTLREQLPTIIDAFVEYYGEENREYIEQKFSNSLLIGFQQPKTIEATVRDIKTEISDELKTEIVEGYNIDKKLLFGTYSHEYDSLMPITKIEEYIEIKDYTIEDKKRDKQKAKVKFFKQFLKDMEINEDNIDDILSSDKGKLFCDRLSNIPYLKGNVDYFMSDEISENEYFRTKKDAIGVICNIYPEVTEENFDEFLLSDKFKELEKLVDRFKDSKKVYCERTEYLEQYEEYCKQCSSLKDELSEQTMFKVAQEMGIFEEKDFEDYKKRQTSSKLYAYFGYGNSYLGSCFNSDNEEILKNGNEWRVDTVKRERMDFFKAMGIDHGRDYEAYMSDPECIKLIPSIEFSDKYSKLFDKYKEQEKIEYYQTIGDYKENREKIDSLNLYCKNDGFDASLYEHGITCVLPNVRYIDGKLVTYPIMSIDMGHLPEYIDAALIHELNHVYELSVIDVKESGVDFVCGWDYVTQELEETDEISLSQREEKRNYELMNEIVNELIAQDITTILHSKGNYIFNDSDNAKIKGSTSYESSMFIIRDFYNKYKKDIIISRKENNIEHLLNTVGKENFEELNELFHVFNSKFAGFGFYNLVGKLKENIDDEDTRLYKEICSKRDSIMIKMEEYSKSKKM